MGEVIIMRKPFTQLYIHLVWATWDRRPLITPQIEPRLYAAITAKCRQLKCEPLAIGGIEDHVHLLTRIHSPISVSHLVKEIKGASSHLIAHEIAPGVFFKWQGAYGAFTLRKSEVPTVRAYILRQKEHHAMETFLLELEKSSD